MYVTIYKPTCGWKAVIIGDQGAECTSDFAYNTPQEAQDFAEKWGKCEDLPVMPHEFDKCPEHPEEWRVDGNCSICDSIALQAKLQEIVARRKAQEASNA